MLLLILAIASAFTITPGNAPPVTDDTPAMSYIQELKEWHRQYGGVKARESLVLPTYNLPRTARPTSYTVQQWLPLIKQYFAPDDVPWAMRVLQCESGGNPQAANSRSSARGLFQHLETYWPQRSALAGWEETSIFDAEANIAVAAWLLADGGPGHWVCK